MFWFLAAALPLIAAVIMFSPVLKRSSRHLGVGLSMLLLIPITSLFIYQSVGTPAAIDPPLPVANVGSASGDELSDLVRELEQRLQETPDDLQGWMLLGRSYKTMARHTDALRALQRARELAPADPFVAVELAEAMIFTSDRDQVNPEIESILTTALAVEPGLQKGLWLMGIISFQQGKDEQAITYWEQLLTQLEPNSSVAQTVQQQVQMARQRSGIEPVATWPGIEAIVLADQLGEVPAGAILYVIARDPGAPRPPLGATRIEQPGFPQQVILTDADSMMAQRPISSAAQIEVFARLSLTGDPLPGPDDPQSRPVVITQDSGPVTLILEPATP